MAEGRKLREREEKLLLALRELEEQGRSYETGDLVSELARKTGYRPSTISTYLGKKLEGQLVHEDGAGKLSVRGALACPEQDFAELMTQKLPAPLDGEADAETELEWRARIRALTVFGLERGYSLTEEDADRLLDLLK
jgi:DNA-binding transcriptional ArsR family regulator